MMTRAPLLSGADQGGERSGDPFSFLGSTHVGGTGRRAPTWFGITGYLFGESPRIVALPPIPKHVYPHVSVHTSHMSSCLSTLKIGKRQNSRFSNRAPRRSRNQPACASNESQKTRQSTIGRSDKSVITCSRDNAWRVAYEVETVNNTL